jgi:hypothetical protein
LGILVSSDVTLQLHLLAQVSSALLLAAVITGTMLLWTKLGGSPRPLLIAHVAARILTLFLLLTCLLAPRI